MTQAVILHTIEDVKHCLKHGLHKNAMLFSTNVNVVYYMKYQCGIECHDLCAYITPQEIRDLQKITLRISNLLLQELDRRISPQINQCLNLSMRYFEPLYAYFSSRQLYLYTLLKHCLSRMLQQYPDFNTILFYGAIVGPLYGQIEPFLSRIFPDTNFLIVRYANSNETVQTRICGVDIEEIPGILRQYEDNWFLDAKTKTQRGPGKCCLIFEPLDRLCLLVQEIGKDNVHVFNSKPITPSNMPKYEINPQTFPLGLLESLPLAADIQATVLLLFEEIREDFCKHIMQYLHVLHFYRRVHETEHIQTVYWEIPPIHAAGALVLEYFLSNGVTKVIGVQSQATSLTGQVIEIYACENIFNRCNYYVSRGTSEKDVDKLYSGTIRKAVILPQNCGMEEEKPLVVCVDERKTIDIAVHFKSTLGLMEGRHIPTHLGIQEGLLSFLCSQQYKKEIHIVSQENLTFENCALFSTLKKLDNVTLINAVQLNNYLTKYLPKLIVIDSSMPYLEYVLDEDVMIILIQNPVVVFSEEALALLKRRVYFAEGLEEVQQLIQLHFYGKLEQKRDTSFKRHYYNQGRLKEVLQYIDTVHY